jgi:hypothetical protein
MKKVYQQIIEIGRGDCMRAAVASMLELEIDAVPHFMLHGDSWWTVYWGFFKSLGYDLVFVRTLRRGKFSREHLPTRKDLVNSSIVAVVPSKTFSNVNHVVLINSKGRVIHDPNPNKKYLGENVIKNQVLLGWDKLTRIEAKTESV